MSEVWHVRLAQSEAQMTLDELDAAYQQGAVDEKTLVREEGTTQWSTLGALLGIDTPAATPPPNPEPHTQESVRPLAVDLDDIDESKLASKGKRTAIVALAACALAIGAAVLAVTKFAEDPGAVKAAAAAQVVVTAAVTTAEPEKTLQKPQLSEEQRQALAKQDAEHEKKNREAREKRARESAPVPQQKTGPVFTKSGDKYDPLNAGL